MREVSFGHQIICLNDPVDVIAMYPYSNTHYHVLWTLGDTSINTQEVGALEGLESEAIQSFQSV
jgi:hypothetical protein